MIERDLYFAAFCIEQGLDYSVDDGKVILLSDSSTIDQMRSEYKSKHKRVLNRVQNLVKELHRQRQESSIHTPSSKNKMLIQW